MDRAHLEFADDTFDVVYAHGILPYTADDQKMVREIQPPLKPRGEALLPLVRQFGRHIIAIAIK